MQCSSAHKHRVIKLEQAAGHLLRNRRAREKMAPTTTKKAHRWYLGGCASAVAACCTHPLDTLKVLDG